MRRGTQRAILLAIGIAATAAPGLAQDAAVPGAPLDLLGARQPQHRSLAGTARRLWRAVKPAASAAPVEPMPYAAVSAMPMPLDFDAAMGEPSSADAEDLREPGTPEAAAADRPRPQPQRKIVTPSLPRPRPLAVLAVTPEPDDRPAPDQPASDTTAAEIAGEATPSAPAGAVVESLARAIPTEAIAAAAEAEPAPAPHSEAAALPEAAEGPGTAAEVDSDASGAGSPAEDIGIAVPATADTEPEAAEEGEVAAEEATDPADDRDAALAGAAEAADAPADSAIVPIVADEAAAMPEALAPETPAATKPAVMPAEAHAEQAVHHHEERDGVAAAVEEPAVPVTATAASDEREDATPQADAALAIAAAEPATVEAAEDHSTSAEAHAEETATPAPEGNAAPSDDGAAAEAAPISYPDGNPRDLVLSLQLLQDRIAAGSVSAFAEQRDLLERIDRAFAAMPAEAWQEVGNATALVTYTLSGGKPTTLREVLTKGPVPPIDEKLLFGALAYVEGRIGAAKAALEQIDARSFPPSVGSQVAIAQAALKVEDDPKGAARLLDVARLVSPGTLAEEAAIRRALPVAAQLGDAAKFRLLARQYVERFPNSVYAGNFRQRLAASVARMDVIDTPEGFAGVDEILSALQPEARIQVLVMVSRAALLKAKSQAAVLAAEAVIADPRIGDDIRAQAELYRAAAALVLPETFDEAEKGLATIDAALLAPSDRELLELASRTAELVRMAADRPAGGDPAPAVSDADEKSAVMQRGETEIARIDKLLETAR